MRTYSVTLNRDELNMLLGAVRLTIGEANDNARRTPSALAEARFRDVADRFARLRDRLDSLAAEPVETPLEREARTKRTDPVYA